MAGSTWRCSILRTSERSLTRRNVSPVTQKIADKNI
jgi:hypothetical protein